ncbi:molybdopterin molybdotransferase MoeA [Rothia sp. ZJ932]|uniref:molybdopterin molybdotransferase MoeA n=1 Tax=Rothia sp. ZJ932 TaxID=2810516 RepID=UPI001968099D|nr:molybdopterin molybdotransferase MoeA [Rothia sp. ZJ932]QRZ62058.1 molybdopterin molybdotransferase MoeA [Rothia sp. ZJ932]
MVSFFTSAHNLSPNSYVDALAALLGGYLPSATQSVPLAQAVGRVLASDVLAAHSSPTFDNSQMDGYALTAVSARRENRVFTVGHDIPAGFSGNVVCDDDIAYPIMTGAPVPAGYGAIVPVERSRVVSADADAQGFAAEGQQVELEQVAPGTFIRTVGEDIQKGELLVPASTLLTAVHVGVLAAQGIAEIIVQSSPRVLLYTGGEEVTTGQLTAGKIYDANAPMLRGLLVADGIDDVYTRQINDDPQSLIKALEHDCAQLNPDLILTCGGISAGRYEVVRNALTSLNTSQKQTNSGMNALSWFGHVSQQPGGPQGVSLLNTGQRQVPFVSLPGNPVSTLVTYTALLRPSLVASRHLAPARVLVAQASLTAEQPVSGLEHKTQFCRGIVRLNPANGALTCHLHGETGSHLLHAASEANALIEFEPSNSYVPGDSVKVHLLPGALFH